MYKILFTFLFSISVTFANNSFDLDSLLKNSKEYVNKGKLLILGETLRLAINNSLDLTTMHVTKLEVKNDSTLKMVVKLLGEDKDFILNITHFDWSISKDKKLIVFENISYGANIGWIEYLIAYYFKITQGYLSVKNSNAVATVLRTIKKDISPTYNTNYAYSKKYWDKIQKDLMQNWIDSDNKDLTNLFSNIFDERYIKINSLKIKDEKIYIDAYLKDSKEGLNFYIDDFSWKIEEDKRYILLENITIKECKKPWIVGALNKRRNSIKFHYSKFVENILKSIKFEKRITYDI